MTANKHQDILDEMSKGELLAWLRSRTMMRPKRSELLYIRWQLQSEALAADYSAELKALQAECEKLRNRARTAERECSKALRTLKGLERVAKVVSDNSDAVCGENNQLRTEREKLRALLLDIGNGCQRREMPDEQDIAEWADRIDAAMQEAT